MDKIQLGAMATDSVTGFRGIITSVCLNLNASPRVFITSTTLDKDGNPIEVWFNAGNLQVHTSPAPSNDSAEAKADVQSGS